MADFLLDATGDLDLSTNDIQIVTGLAAIRQELQIRYRLWLGEWFLNTAEGVPYLGNILGKGGDEARTRAIMVSVATGTPGVDVVQSYGADYDGPTRTLTITLGIGATIGGELVYDTFVIPVEI